MTRIGTFSVTTGQLIAVDPIVRSGGVRLPRVHKGKWTAYMTMRNNVVTELCVHARTTPRSEWEPFKGLVGVDSGMLGFFAVMPADGDIDMGLARKKPAMVTKDGALSYSGYGDGGYSIDVIYFHGLIVGARCVFVSEDKSKEEDMGPVIYKGRSHKGRRLSHKGRHRRPLSERTRRPAKDKHRKLPSKYTKRPSPPLPANEYCHQVKKGNDGQWWISKPAKNGICRWTVKHGGMHPTRKKPSLTINVAQSHVDEEERVRLQGELNRAKAELDRIESVLRHTDPDQRHKLPEFERKRAMVQQIFVLEQALSAFEH
jgi:hypothetical protein